MGKARRKRGLIAIEAIKGMDMAELAKQYNLSKNRIRKAIKAGLAANGISADTRANVEEGLAQLRKIPEEAIEKIKCRAGLSSAAASLRPAAKASAARKSASDQKAKSDSAAKDEAAANSGDTSDTEELPTRLQNLLLDSPYAKNGVIDKAALAGASLDDLQALPGCGKASAEKIKAWASGT